MMTTKQVQTHESSCQLQFGAFRLDTHNRVIDQTGSPLRLGSRARHILTTLLEHAGETVAKKELMARVWPRGAADEGTLRVHISALRRALGDSASGGSYIENVTGQGYRFVAPVRQGRATERVPGLPFPLQRLIGRAGSISAVTAWLPTRRLVTVVGPGGVGKTGVVLATADRLRESYPDGVCLVDLAGVGVADPFSIGRSVAAALGISTDSDDVLSAVIEYLKPRRTLVVLDSCERVVDGAAILAEELLGGAPNLNVIATSREPLRAKGEWVLRLGPLEFPAPAVLTAEQALKFPAIQLFVERATDSLHTFELHDTDVAEVVEICRRLDGLPLAIELAAARVDLFGVHGLAADLYNRPGLLTGGYRTAVSRHQSLRAMLDWSYEILTPVEQVVLRRLAVFAAPFDLASATAVVVDDAIDATDVLDTLANLTAKSLLVTHASGELILYRLFETSRAFALEKLECSQDLMEIRRRHVCLQSRFRNPGSSAQIAAAPPTTPR
jgi:predicted ATPase/DNA-binding winged helix-turn-helix (wHTH) protein